MKVLTFLRTGFLAVALVFAFAAVVIHGEYMGDKFAVESVRSAGIAVDNPENPQPLINFFLLWAFRFGSGWAFSQAIILALKICRERKVWKIINRVIEADHPLRADSMHKLRSVR